MKEVVQPLPRSTREVAKMALPGVKVLEVATTGTSSDSVAEEKKIPIPGL